MITELRRTVARRLQPARHLPPRAPREALAEWRRLAGDPLYMGEGVAGVEGLPALLVPGFGAPRRAMSALERWLERLGLLPRVASTRLGLDCAERCTSALERELETAAADHGRPALLVAHSRGGQFARAAAVRRPEAVAGLIALGAPWKADPREGLHRPVLLTCAVVGAAGSLGVPMLLRLGCVSGPCCERFRHDLEGAWPEGVPFASLYSRGDRTVRWETCLDPAAHNLEISGTHVGMLASRSSYEAIGRWVEAELSTS